MPIYNHLYSPNMVRQLIKNKTI